MTNDARLGEVLRDGDRWGLRYRRRLAHPPEKVWRALTESANLVHWFPADIVGERRVGATLELPFWPAHVERYDIPEPVMTGELLTWDPPDLFEWTWGGDHLRWELEAVDGGTVLTFTTWLLEGGAEPAANTGAGYHACLDNLVELLDAGAVSRPLVEVPVAPLEERYRDAVGA